MDLWIDQVQEKMGRKSATQGPQGTMSAKSRQSVEILIESLSSMKDFFHKVNPGFQSYLKLATALTLAVENFYSQMRSRNDMPTVLEFAYLFVPNIRESLKQLTDTGFVYYTSPHSYYEAPESTKIPFRDLPSIPYPASVEMSKEDPKTMRDWQDNFGKPVCQLTIRNQSTKDNVGTFTLYACKTLDPLPRPLDFSDTNEITATHKEVTEMQQVSGGACLFKGNSVVVVKHDHIRGFPLRGPFFVGSILTDTSDKELNSLCESQLFVPSFEDCLLFRLHGRVSIHRDGIVGKVEEGHFQRDKCSQTERSIVQDISQISK